MFPSASNRHVYLGRVLAIALFSAFIGSSFGIAGGPLGAVAGTIPFAVTGAVLARQYYKAHFKCPHCDIVIKL